MFYGSPFPPPQGGNSGAPAPMSPLGMGVPPVGAGVPVAKKGPEELAFQEARAALKQECKDNVPLLMGEVKKLSMAVLEACEILDVAERRGLTLPKEAVLQQEMQHQVMAYALMRFLPEDDLRAAAELSAGKIVQGFAENPPVGKAGVFVRELEGRVKDTPRNQESIKQWLLTQPLFRVLNQNPTAFANLEQHFREAAPKMNQLIQSTNESLTSLLQQQSSLRPGGGMPSF